MFPQLASFTFRDMAQAIPKPKAKSGAKSAAWQHFSDVYIPKEGKYQWKEPVMCLVPVESELGYCEQELVYN